MLCATAWPRGLQPPACLMLWGGGRQLAGERALWAPCGAWPPSQTSDCQGCLLHMRWGAKCLPSSPARGRPLSSFPGPCVCSLCSDFPPSIQRSRGQLAKCLQTCWSVRQTVSAFFISWHPEKLKWSVLGQGTRTAGLVINGPPPDSDGTPGDPSWHTKRQWHRVPQGYVPRTESQHSHQIQAQGFLGQ